jgi:AcrR family transcriptional regulator
VITPKQASRPVRSRKPEAVRERILDAAQAEFMAHGFAAASTNRILERFAGSKPTMFRHFPTKREMFAGVVQRIASRWRSEIDPARIDAPDPQSWLNAFGLLALAWITSDENLFVGRMAVAEGAEFPEVAELYTREAVEPIEGALASRLATWSAGGLITTTDPERDALAFLDLTLAGQVSRRLYGAPPPSPAAVAAHVGHCVGVFLQGRLVR